MILVSVVDVVVVVVVVLFADDISGLGRLVVLTVETRSQSSRDYCIPLLCDGDHQGVCLR